MPVERFRRHISTRKAWAVERPGNMVYQEDESSHQIGKWQPSQVIDGRVEHSVDVFENRLLNLFYDQVQRRLRRLGNRLGQMAGQEKLANQARALLDSL